VIGLRRVAGRLVPAALRAQLVDWGPYGFSGRYETWEAAERAAGNPEPEIAIARLSAATDAVRTGAAPYEQDSVAFPPPAEASHMLRLVDEIAAGADAGIRVLDFGGSFGSKYFWIRRHLSPNIRLDWHVVELPRWAAHGAREFATEALHFSETIDDAVERGRPDLILCSSVLQYIEDPFAILARLMATGAEYLLLDRTPYSVSGRAEIVLQRVSPQIYPAAHATWLLSEAELRAFMAPSYRLVNRFSYRQVYTRRAVFRGHVFRRIVPPSEIGRPEPNAGRGSEDRQ
jgi:putative methyltransferase (TIGR04325 family)